MREKKKKGELPADYSGVQTWHAYCVEYDPSMIEAVIGETRVTSAGKSIHLDIYGGGVDDGGDVDDGTVGAPGRRGPTVVFVHGTAVYGRFYADFLFGLYKAGLRVVALDLPGHGLSEGKRGHFTVGELVTTVRDVVTYVLERFGGDVVVVGSSLGGITSLYLAAEDERIRAAVCVNAALLNEKAHERIVKVHGILRLLKPLVPALARVMPSFRLSVWHYLDALNLFSKQDWVEIFQVLLGDPLVSDRYTLKSLASQMRDPPARPVEEIRTPVLILNGSHDVLFSVEYMREIFGRLERSEHKRLEIVPDSPHLVLQEHREESTAIVLDWLGELGLL
ncbi:MAG: alpha/beta hydrolase [Promethearchaeota archaeon]